MTRLAAGLLLAGVVAATADAHYVFVLPADGDKPPRVVFADAPDADPMAGLDPVAGGRFVAVDPVGRAEPLTLKPGGDGWLAVAGLPGEVAEVRGTVEYGVVVRGADPALIVHHPKAVFGMPAAEPAQRSDAMPLELTPVAGDKGVAVRLTAGGRPVGSADVVVYLPGEKRPKVVKTDASGVTTAFDAAGVYAARAYAAETKDGEFQGRAYKQVRRYATLTFRVDRAK